ncbi:thioredoxin-dependent thiol peroxidase [Calothrix sp. UHCC 0171]|uniref:thioredoxin-dependent thiol peroxidase n=1 Tax=Calothrix sp. UHCC 0171 TaxID=3110245 RepID=UPI002B21D9FD|nr:thioredoxin-dependent thiol peroxidase [Calothrix sp. UHCC 0171]MEA5571520.1 thioredoxin-dependent thiol peroxidase [Calothrix sp. UHCC 0171]
MTTPQPGQNAPAFSASNQNGETINLEDFQGKWLILYFYPKDDTPGCTTEAKDFSAFVEDFMELGAEILGVSTDSTTKHCKFIDKHNLKITLLSDPEHQVADAYGVWKLKKFMGKEYMGIERSTFLISPDRKIAYTWSKVKVKEHVADVLKQLQLLIKN